jgi:ATP-dependent helicase/nuclease subunit A
MRILYVALTRAREKLILTANKKAKHVISLLESVAAEPPDWKLAQARNTMDWILLCFWDQSKLHRAFETSGRGVLKDENLFHLERIRHSELNTLTDEILNAKKTLKTAYVLNLKHLDKKNKHAKIFENIQKNLKARYPFEDATQAPAKLSVSELTHRDDEYAGTNAEWDFSKRPAIVETAGPASSPLSLGSAVHRVFEHIDLGGDCDLKAVQSTLQRLMQTEQLSPVLAEKIDPVWIEAFFQNELGRLARSASADVLREWPFTYALDAAAAGIKSDEEFIILQGIIDMIIPTESGLVIVDLKTDRVTESDLQQRVDRYTPQLNYYARAASGILKQPIHSAWLYFLRPAKSIQVKAASAVSCD